MRSEAFVSTVLSGRGVAGQTNSAMRLRYGFRIPLLHNHEGYILFLCGIMGRYVKRGGFYGK